MKYVHQRYFGYTDEPNDIDYFTDFLARNRDKDKYTEKLMSLKAGQFLYKYVNKVEESYIEPFNN